MTATAPTHADPTRTEADAARRCKCSHPRSSHYTDRRGRPVCGSAACGCIEYRERGE